MKVAIMQPYFMPYLGYFQLINAVDTFLFFDQVHFIKKGWINRNRILVQQKDYLFTIPLVDVSQNKLIKETFIDEKSYPQWKAKFLKTITQAYKNAPYFDTTLSLLETILNHKTEQISELAMYSVLQIAKLLSIKTDFKTSTTIASILPSGKVEKLLFLCKMLNATEYVNPIKGQALYKKEAFLEAQINLHFLKSNRIQYPQFNHEYVADLSMIDVLMFNAPETISQYLKEYELV